MSENRWWIASGLLLALLIAGRVAWQHLPSDQEIEPLPVWYAQDGKSEDLAEDLKRMWDTQIFTGTPDPSQGPDPHVSSSGAIVAASRVFNTVELVGKTREEVIALLGHPKTSSDSIYHSPFWRAPPNALVYRFDTGVYGWQFNVLFAAGKVSKVDRLPIS